MNEWDLEFSLFHIQLSQSGQESNKSGAFHTEKKKHSTDPSWANGNQNIKRQLIKPTNCNVPVAICGFNNCNKTCGSFSDATNSASVTAVHFPMATERESTLESTCVP